MSSMSLTEILNAIFASKTLKTTFEGLLMSSAVGFFFFETLFSKN